MSVSSFIYRRAFAQQEKGGKTYFVMKDLIKHADGHVTYNPVRTDIHDKEQAKQLARMISFE